MADVEIAQAPPIQVRYSKVRAYAVLAKFRLSFLVVLSAVISYLTVTHSFSWQKIASVVVGGFLVTGAANGFNQIIERELDKLMNRTCKRPLPLGILSLSEALTFCVLSTVSGIFILTFFTNVLCGILGALSVVLYAGVYTPLKRVTPFSVFVGAFPGAIPTLIGAVADTDGFGEITFFAWALFAVQFVWQFPHFWAIAWVAHEDYKKAGFFMLPSLGGQDRSSAFQIVVYTLFLVPVSLIPHIFGLSSWVAGMFTFLCGLFFLAQAFTLYYKMDISSARKLMFGSFFYLPLVQLIIMFGAIWK
ncbi:MAG: protoheme IX farnesyltransferase [Bacteroidetes bacterium]|nr:protoheme IX farnesyltransferase [Bacteroidota bacterium]